MEHKMANRCRTTSRRGQTGQSLPEFLVVVPVFLFLVLLIFQLVLIYRAKTTLDYAALEAARAGAVNNAKMDAMEDGLIRGLMPLYTTSGDVAGLAKAYAATTLDVKGLGGFGGNARIKIISPTQQSWNEFKEKQYNGQEALPNDNLAFRDDKVGSSGVNVQDANILKIQVNYDFPLVVPFVDRVLRGDSEFVKNDGFFDPANVDMKSPLLGGGGPDPMHGEWVLGRHFRIPLKSTAIVRMQTPIYNGDSLPDAGGTTPPGGGGDPPGGGGDPPGGGGDPPGGGDDPPGGGGDPPGGGDDPPGGGGDPPGGGDDPPPGDDDPEDPEDPICT